MKYLLLLFLSFTCTATDYDHGVIKLKEGGKIFYDADTWYTYQHQANVPKRAEPMAFDNATSYNVVIITELGHVHMIRPGEIRIWEFDRIETIRFKGWHPQNTDVESKWISSFLQAFYADDISDAAEAGKLLRQDNLREL
jgi:hypothetical protein